MKKEAVLTLRVDAEINDAIRCLAKNHDRTMAWVARTLIVEALERRKVLKQRSK